MMKWFPTTERKQSHIRNNLPEVLLDPSKNFGELDPFFIKLKINRSKRLFKLYRININIRCINTDWAYFEGKFTLNGI